MLQSKMDNKFCTCIMFNIDIRYLEVKLQGEMVEAFQVQPAQEDHKDMLDDVGVIPIVPDDPCEDDYVEIPLQNFF